AILLSGPGGVGKTTLALDLAAGLLCVAPDRATRPCGVCRGCRMVAHGNHPDVHLLGPEGVGRQIVIGGGDGRARGVRDLVGELSLMPVEGGCRVAVVEEAHRMNEDAQSALLKTLEEPPAGVTIVLCADEEERLLPTVRSRCARIRLGAVPARDIEAILAELAVADPPTAARLGRLAQGRPGAALAYARAPDAVVIRAEIVRILLDLVTARSGPRLAGMRDLLGRAAELGASLKAALGDEGGAQVSGGPEPDVVARRTPAGERRDALVGLLSIWMDLTRDLALAELGEVRALRDPGLLEELKAASSGVPRDGYATFLRRLVRAAELLECNVAPELIADSLVLAWPRRAPAA
ncbi:MAG: AAA family ATPase, partial [Chloroflexi bacterium]|nr:AAA family ATPase [Chloroflexota bacterium]